MSSSTPYRYRSTPPPHTTSLRTKPVKPTEVVVPGKLTPQCLSDRLSTEQITTAISRHESGDSATISTPPATARAGRGDTQGRHPNRVRQATCLRVRGRGHDD